MRMRTLKQSSILACPFVIIDAEHYREDETCRCNDAAEQQRMREEWEYTDEIFREAGVTPLCPDCGIANPQTEHRCLGA